MSENYTLTPTLGLFKPNYRKDSGKWGDHWNANADVLDTAFSRSFGSGGPYLPLSGGDVSGPTSINTLTLAADGIGYGGLPIGDGGAEHNRVGFTWTGSTFHGYVGGVSIGDIAILGRNVFSMTGISATGGFNPTTDIPSGYLGSYTITNQPGASGWPTGQADNTGFIIAGFNSNPGWPNKLMMGGRYPSTGGIPLWFQTSDATWWEVISNRGGAITGDLKMAMVGFNNTAPIAKPAGYTAPTGTATRATFATSTVTLPVLAEHVKALIDDLTAYGLIGT